jgi:hypothetical protein
MPKNQNHTTTSVDKSGSKNPETEKVVQDTKQPSASNQPIRKTDPSHHAFADDEEE